MHKKYYVGLHVRTGNRFLFQASTTPTEAEYGTVYCAVIGPFRTKRGAVFMRDYGRGNPHCQHVDDAERLARVCHAQKEAYHDNRPHYYRGEEPHA